MLALQECDHSQTDSLEDEEIETFYKILTQRKEIDRTFAEATGSKETLSVDQLVTFLQHQQREAAAGPALALSLIERYEPNETGEGLRPAVPGPTRREDLWGDGSPSRELEGRGRLSRPQGPWAILPSPCWAQRLKTSDGGPVLEKAVRRSCPRGASPSGGQKRRRQSPTLGYSHGLVKRLKLTPFQEIPEHQLRMGGRAVGPLLPGRSDRQSPSASQPRRSVR